MELSSGTARMTGFQPPLLAFIRLGTSLVTKADIFLLASDTDDLGDHWRRAY